MERHIFNEDDLPHNFKNVISFKDDHVVEIRSSVKNLSDIDDGLPAKVSVKLNHSHDLNTAAALGYLKPLKDTREIFENYFQNGLTVAESIKFHEATLEQTSDYEITVASARNMPKYRTVSYWHDVWRKLNFGTRTGNDINS